MQARPQQHIVDNLTQVADDMIAYILQASDDEKQRLQHRDEVAAILKKVEDQYNAPTSSYLSPTAWVLWMTRSRAAELQTAKDNVNSIAPKDTTLGMLESITRLLEKGGVEATSANTTLLNELVAKLKKYEALDKEADLTPELQTTIRKRLRLIFVAKAHKELNEYRKFQELLQSESKSVAKTADKPKKLDASKTKAIKNKLATLLKERAKPEERVVQTSKQRETKSLKDESGHFKNEQFKAVAASLAAIHGQRSGAGLYKPEPRREHNHNTQPNEHFKAAQRELEQKLGQRFK